MFHALFDAPVVILRPSFVYGPGQEPTKLIPYVIKTLLEGGSPRLSSGERRLDCVYAEDVAQAYVDAALVAGVEGETIDIGCGTLSSVRSIVERVVELLGPTPGQPVFDALPVRPFEQEVQVDVEGAGRTLEWWATTRLQDGLRRTIDWYQEESPREMSRTLAL
jgi:UDP-glucose 4-epimerase